MLPIAAPIDKIAGPPTGFALDAVFEIDDDLHLALWTGSGLVHVSGADVPE